MDLNEVKDLYAEGLTLFKRIQKYGKEYPYEETERVDKVGLFLLYRVCSNIHSTILLTTVAYKKGKFSFYQLPIGIILRCCFTDCLFALYIQRVSKAKACEELDLRAIEYANSMLERKEVYRDQVKSTGNYFDDGFINHLWELTRDCPEKLYIL